MIRLATKSRITPRLLHWKLLIAFFLPLTCGAWAVENDRDMPVTPFRITDISGRTGIRFDYLSESQKRNGSDDIQLSNRSFQEYLLYRLRGYVYHPLFLDFRTNFKIALLQQMVDRSGTSGDLGGDGSSNSFLYGYDVYLHFLKEHPLSLMLFANKDRSAVIQIFSDRQLIDTERWGAVLNWKKDPFPMNLSVSRTRLQEWGADSRSESTNTLIEYIVRNELKKRIYTELRYRYLDYEQDFRASNPQIDIKRQTELRTHDISLINTIYLTETRTSYLNTFLRLLKQSGTQEHSGFQWQERLHLRHSPSFQTYYLLGYITNRFDSTEVRTWRAEAGLDHRLYQSLESHLDVHGRWVKFNGYTENEYGVTGRLNYRKHTPWGYLTAGYGLTLDEVERSGRVSRITIVDESLTMRDGFTVFLSKPGVIADSIQVSDTSGFIFYDEGFDYEIEVRGNRTGLRLSPAGRIGDGDTVLVDYDLTRTQDVNYISANQSASIRYDFERFVPGLAVYYRWQDLAAHGAPSGDDFTILEFTDQVAGFRYRWRWLTWTEEYETYRSNFSNYDQLLSQLEGSHRLSNNIRMGWQAGFLAIDYKDSHPDSSYSNSAFGSLMLNGRMRRNGYWEVEARARKETGLTEETLLGLAGKMGFQWRKLHFEAGARAQQRKRFDSERDRMQVFMELSREF